MKNESKPSCVEQIADSEINSAGKCQISLKLLSGINSEPSNGISNEGTVESFETTSRTKFTPETVAQTTSKMASITSQPSTSTSGTELTTSYVERGVRADDDDEDAGGGGGAVDCSTMEDAMEVNTLNEWKLGIRFSVSNYLKLNFGLENLLCFSRTMQTVDLNLEISFLKISSRFFVRWLFHSSIWSNLATINSILESRLKKTR